MLCSLLHYAGVLLLLVGAHLIVANGKSSRGRGYDRYDVFVVARCEAKCWQNRNKNSCVNLCLLKSSEKPGNCPSRENEDLSETGCYDICKTDEECSGVKKCCRQKCRASCLIPANLHNNTGLPEIPTNVSIRSKGKRAVFIKWKIRGREKGVVYVVQERHGDGGTIGEWRTCWRTIEDNVLIKHFVKAPRWYEFRVAAVNSYGTKGFSDVETFSAKVVPRPPKAPVNMTTGYVHNFNNSLHVELKWSTPQSYLPIQFYKVFWSRRLLANAALDTVQVLQRTISPEENNFVIHDLEPNSLYFLQVQALIGFGNDFIRGEKSGLVINTTSFINSSDLAENIWSRNGNPFTGIKDLQLKKLFWGQGDLKARISWTNKDSKYIVSWKSGQCKKDKTASNLKLSGTTKLSEFYIDNLHFDCRYRVSVKDIFTKNNKDGYEASITFTTPSCKDLQKRNKRIRCNKRSQ